MAEKIRNVEVRDVELDEVWGFIREREKRVKPGGNPNFGDCPDPERICTSIVEQRPI